MDWEFCGNSLSLHRGMLLFTLYRCYMCVFCACDIIRQMWYMCNMTFNRCNSYFTLRFWLSCHHSQFSLPTSSSGFVLTNSPPGDSSLGRQPWRSARNLLATARHFRFLRFGSTIFRQPPRCLRSFAFLHRRL